MVYFSPQPAATLSNIKLLLSSYTVRFGHAQPLFHRIVSAHNLSGPIVSEQNFGFAVRMTVH